MAYIILPKEDRRIEKREEISAFLAPFGIYHERWPLEERVNPDAAPEEILAAYKPEIDVLKSQGGYVTADVINVTPQTAGLEAMLDRFRKEHTHSEDEVRFILKGRGIFFIDPPNASVFGIQVEAGDLINVPLGTRHWFDLCEEKTIRAIRLFQDKAGWTPHYVEDGKHAGYAPVCWGPAFVPGMATVGPAVKL
jgi:1,2-dihydroxy-3-keto-5-methylthiopentene dioxygenase